MMEIDYRTEEQKRDYDDNQLRAKVAINSDTEEDDSDEDEELKAAKKAIYARNYIRKTVVEDSSDLDSQSDY